MLRARVRCLADREATRRHLIIAAQHAFALAASILLFVVRSAAFACATAAEWANWWKKSLAS
jgi:hypothetical protein